MGDRRLEFQPACRQTRPIIPPPRPPAAAAAGSRSGGRGRELWERRRGMTEGYGGRVAR